VIRELIENTVVIGALGAMTAGSYMIGGLGVSLIVGGGLVLAAAIAIKRNGG
jgi:hypothetical protein